MNGAVRSFLASARRTNVIAGQECAPVVCRRSGPVFMWRGMTGWYSCDTLPEAIYDHLPKLEQERVVRHAHRRMATDKHRLQRAEITL